MSKINMGIEIDSKKVFLWSPNPIDSNTYEKFSKLLPIFQQAPSKSPFMSGVKACHDVYEQLRDVDIIDSYYYERSCRNLRKAFPHLIIGEGKGAYHYYLIEDFKQWIEEEFA